MLNETLYAPSIAFTLISIGWCDDAGYQTQITYQKCAILSTAGTLLMQALKLGGLYRLDLQPPGNEAHQCLTAMEIHRRMGHISHKSLRYLLDHGMILGLETNSFGNKITCDACIKSKIARKPLPKEPWEHSKKFGDWIYSCGGPSIHPTINKTLSYVSFIDKYSRESVIYLMATKDEAFSKYKLYEAMMLRQRDVHVKSLISDREVNILVNNSRTI
jgi:GAG-pre-integrase domain